MEQAYNPYLPLTEYVPDGEPHVFGGRLYIFGSHDRADGRAYCEQDYAVWSAPVSDLRNWRFDGVSYRKEQDPSNADGTKQLWAPDVAQGPDGRFYLYYCLNFHPEVGVAVAERPEGPYEFLGHVHYPVDVRGGKVVDEGMVFDPAVLVDGGRVFLYYGFAPAGEKAMVFPSLTDDEVAALPPEERERYLAIRSMPPLGEWSMVVELKQDMVTAKEEPRQLIPGEGHSAGTSFEGHGFFEASSIRRFGETYYFVYSSHKSHELCYATSKEPDRGFVYGGTLVSNGDIGFEGRTSPNYPLSNNHGGLVRVGDEYYVFYHRATHGTEYSRQGCAERVTMAEDGSIAQVQTTSCGLNGGALATSGTYPAAIACHLTDHSVTYRIDYGDASMRKQVMVTERQGAPFITNIRDGATVGYRFFAFNGAMTLGLEVRGDFTGTIVASHDEAGLKTIGQVELEPLGTNWHLVLMDLDPKAGDQPLFLSFAGEGTLDLKTLVFMA